MTDNEITKDMTRSLRMLNKVMEKMEILESIRGRQTTENDSCPFCDFVHGIILTDIRKLEEIRDKFIEISKSTDHDEKIKTSAFVITLAIETDKKYTILGAFLEIAHDFFSDIAKSRVQEVNLDDHPEIKEALKDLIRKEGIPMPFNRFDPSKAN